MCDPRTQNSQVRLRTADPEDIAGISRINDQSGLSHWAPGEYRSLMTRPGIDCVVAEKAGQVIGFCLFWRIGPEADLLKIAVEEPFRGTGVGRILMAHFLESAAQAGVEVCFLEVRRSNEAALGLYSSFGFEECGVRRAYYAGPVEDALILQCKTGQTRLSE